MDTFAKSTEFLADFPNITSLNGERYCPLNHMKPESQAKVMEIIDSFRAEQENISKETDIKLFGDVRLRELTMDRYLVVADKIEMLVRISCRLCPHRYKNLNGNCDFAGFKHLPICYVK